MLRRLTEVGIPLPTNLLDLGFKFRNPLRLNLAPGEFVDLALETLDQPILRICYFPSVVSTPNVSMRDPGNGVPVSQLLGDS